jgi:hypothetical protein
MFDPDCDLDEIDAEFKRDFGSDLDDDEDMALLDDNEDNDEGRFVSSVDVYARPFIGGGSFV